jgi:hypothetical protein
MGASWASSLEGAHDMVHLMFLAFVHAVHACFECRHHRFFAWMRLGRFTPLRFLLPWGVVLAYFVSGIAVGFHEYGITYSLVMPLMA